MKVLSQRTFKLLLDGVKAAGRRSISSQVSQEFTVDRLSGERSGIALFSMNRPEAKNSISRNLLKLFYEAIDSVRYDKSVRVIILRSCVPNVFCAGADLKERSEMSPEEVPVFVNRARALMGELESLPQPVIAALDGAALGGGLEMALASDIRIATSSSKLGLVETKLAIIPGAGGTQRLPRIIGIAKAKELIFTGRVVNGEEAARCGLVNHCVPQNAQLDAAFQKSVELAEEILPQGPVALNMAKIAIQRGMNVDLHAGLAIEQMCYAQVIPTKDRVEGLKAFKQKRKPQYIGE